MPSNSSTKLAQTNPSELAAKSASDRKKQALVAVLLVGLVIAIATAPAKETADPSEGDWDATQSAKLTTVSALAPEKEDTKRSQSTELTTSRQFSRMEIDAIVNLPLFTSEPSPQQQSVTVARPQSVQAVYGTATGRAALLGESIVRDGQSLPGGAEVLSVTDQGVEIGTR